MASRMVRITVGARLGVVLCVLAELPSVVFLLHPVFENPVFPPVSVVHITIAHSLEHRDSG